MKMFIITSMCLIIGSASFSQAAKQASPSANESMTCSCCKKEIKGTTVGEDVKHAGSCCKTPSRILGTIPLIHLAKNELTIIGKTDEGLVLQTENGTKVLMGTDNSYKLLNPNNKEKKETLLKLPKGQLKVKLIGTTDDGVAVWADPDGKGGCTLNPLSGKKNDYVGHVTLLR